MKLGLFFLIVGTLVLGFMHQDFVVKHPGEILIGLGLGVILYRYLALWFRIRLLKRLNGG